MGRHAFAQERFVASAEGVALGEGQPGCAGGAGLRHGHAHLAQERFELAGPGLVQLLLEEGECAQMMGVAQRVAAPALVAIASPTVVQAHATEAGLEADGLQRPRPALGMHRVRGQLGRARHLHPPQTSGWNRFLP